VRHKVLDLIGDLALAGRRIEGHVVAERAGHAMHTALVSRLLKDRSAWELAHVPVEIPYRSTQNKMHIGSAAAKLLPSAASAPVWIAREDADQIRVLIGHQHPALRRVQHKVARSLAAAVEAPIGVRLPVFSSARKL
jgi:hypothetical protein